MNFQPTIFTHSFGNKEGHIDVPSEHVKEMSVLSSYKDTGHNWREGSTEHYEELAGMLLMLKTINVLKIIIIKKKLRFCKNQSLLGFLQKFQRYLCVISKILNIIFIEPQIEIFT